MASFLQSFINPKKEDWGFIARSTQRPRNYGLQFDLYDPYYDIDVKEALNRLPREVVDAGNQHLKWAMDLSMKHQYLLDDLQCCCLVWQAECYYMCIRDMCENSEFQCKPILDPHSHCDSRATDKVCRV